MNLQDFFYALLKTQTYDEANRIIIEFEEMNRDKIGWAPFGNRENNRGIIELSTDPGRSLVERVTNGVDAVLEDEFEKHHGIPSCNTPGEAAMSWLGVPLGGLSELSPAQRRQLSQRLHITLLTGDGVKEARTIEIRDFGIGMQPSEMPNTILSLNESNKWKKRYLSGTYGQGGSSTLASSKLTFIATRNRQDTSIGFTVVKYLDLPVEEYKTGHYVFLKNDSNIPTLDLPIVEFQIGTLVKHFGYDLTNYSSPLGPGSIYGLLNQVLFDPIMPVWLDNRIHEYRRVIKGSRNSLNGAVDEGDEDKRGPKVAHRVPMFYITFEDFGRLGIEYWVLAQPTTENKRPIASYVNPSKPIILSVNGQNQEEMSSVLVRRQAELPFLTQRLIGHIDCNHLNQETRRALFASTREGARKGLIYDLIQKELVRVLKSDDELIRLNYEARQQGMRSQDEQAVQQMKKEVAGILKVHGLEVAQAVGGNISSNGNSDFQPIHPPRPRPKPKPIDLHEPPTYIRIVWDADKKVEFYPEQRRYIRIETDAKSSYHNHNDLSLSRINFIVNGDEIKLRGSTPLQEGRCRAIFECILQAELGKEGVLRVELNRQGLPSLSDERFFKIIEKPKISPITSKVYVPPFELREVEGPEDPNWINLGWPDDVRKVSSSADMEEGKLVIYWSTVFPKYLNQREMLEKRDSSLSVSFTERYKIWLAVHSLLLQHDQKDIEKSAKDPLPTESASISEETLERDERNRLATIAAMFAVREVLHIGESISASE